MTQEIKLTAGERAVLAVSTFAILEKRCAGAFPGRSTNFAALRGGCLVGQP